MFPASLPRSPTERRGRSTLHPFDEDEEDRNDGRARDDARRPVRRSSPVCEEDEAGDIKTVARLSQVRDRCPRRAAAAQRLGKGAARCRRPSLGDQNSFGDLTSGIRVSSAVPRNNAIGESVAMFCEGRKISSVYTISRCSQSGMW